MEKRTIVAHLTVQTGKEKAFIEAAQPLIEGTRKEEGNIRYNLYQDTEHPASFIFYEEYKDDAALGAHAASTHYRNFGKVKAEMLACPPEVEKY